MQECRACVASALPLLTAVGDSGRDVAPPARAGLVAETIIARPPLPPSRKSQGRAPPRSHTACRERSAGRMRAS